MGGEQNYLVKKLLGEWIAMPYDQNIFVIGAKNMTHIYIWTFKIIMVVIFSSHAYCSVDIPMPKGAKGRESEYPIWGGV